MTIVQNDKIGAPILGCPLDAIAPPELETVALELGRRRVGPGNTKGHEVGRVYTCGGDFGESKTQIVGREPQLETRRIYAEVEQRPDLHASDWPVTRDSASE